MFAQGMTGWVLPLVVWLLPALVLAGCAPCDPSTEYALQVCAPGQTAAVCAPQTRCTGREVEIVAPTPTSDRQCGPSELIDCVISGDWVNRTVANAVFTNRFLPQRTDSNGRLWFTDVTGSLHLRLLYPEEAAARLPEFHPNDRPAWYVFHNTTNQPFLLVAAAPNMTADVAEVPSHAWEYFPTFAFSIINVTSGHYKQDPSLFIQCQRACTMETDPCCFLDSHFNVSNPEDSSHFLLSLPEARACLGSLTMDAARARSTLESLRLSIERFYSFADIAVNSTAGDAHLDPRLDDCRFDVHPIAFDLRGWIDNQLRELDRSADLDIDQHVTLPELKVGRVGAADFYYGLMAATRRLRDAHTSVRQSLLSTSTVELGVRFQLLSSDATNESAPVHVLACAHDGHQCSQPLHPVETINGDLAWSFLQRLVEFQGDRKSRGARLNNLLGSVGVGGSDPLTYLDLFGPDWSSTAYDDGVVLNYYSGEQVVVTPRISMHPFFRTTNGLLLQSFFERQLANELGPVLVTPALPKQAPAKLRRGSEIIVESERFLEARWVDNNTVLLKILSFGIDGHTSYYHFSEVNRVAGVLIDALLSSGQRPRLLLDMSTNGGGFVNLLWFMFQLILGPERWSTSAQLCEPVNIRLNQDLHAWLSMLQSASELVSDWTPQPNSSALFALFTDNRNGLIDRLREIDPQIQNEEIFSDAEFQLTAAISHYDLDVPEPIFRKVLQNLLTRNNRIAGKTLSGIIQSLPNTEIFDDIEPWQLLAGQRTRNWGGREANYSALHTLSCDTFTNILRLRAVLWHPYLANFSTLWSEIGLITDGMCGSACAAFTTAMLFSGNVTVFSYGGLPGEPMDTSSFCGGNVESWDNIWSNFAKTQAVVRFLRMNSTTPDPPALDLPLAYNFPGGVHSEHVRFNFHQLFFRHLGPDALPREWYNLPAHRQWPVWPGDIHANPDQLELIYNLTLATNWTEVRLAPQFYPAHCTVPFDTDMDPVVLPSTTVPPTTSTTTPSTTSTTASTTTTTLVTTSVTSSISDTATARPSSCTQSDHTDPRLYYVPVLTALLAAMLTALTMAAVFRKSNRQATQPSSTPPDTFSNPIFGLADQQESSA